MVVDLHLPSSPSKSYADAVRCGPHAIWHRSAMLVTRRDDSVAASAAPPTCNLPLPTPSHSLLTSSTAAASGRGPRGAGSFQGLVERGEIVVEKRMELLQGRLELGGSDLVILAVRAGRGRRGRPVAADDRFDSLDQTDHGRLVATSPGRIAGELFAQVQQLQLQVVAS